MGYQTHIFHAAIATLSLSFLSACATATPAELTSKVTPEQMVDFKSGDNALLVINGQGNLSCDRYYLSLRHKETGGVKFISSAKEEGFSTTHPAIVAVPPGHYKFSKGTCYRYGYTGGSLPLLSLWFREFEVKAGEIVYPGTLTPSSINVKTKLKGLDALLAFSTTEDRNYVSYTVEDQSEEIISRLKAAYPDIDEKWVMRTPEAIITKTEYEAVIKDSFEPDEEGNRPTIEQARERYRDNITEMLKSKIDTLIEEAKQEKNKI